MARSAANRLVVDLKVCCQPANLMHVKINWKVRLNMTFFRVFMYITMAADISIKLPAAFTVKSLAMGCHCQKHGSHK